MKFLLSMFMCGLLAAPLYGKADPSPNGYAASVEYLYMLNSMDQPYFAAEVPITVEPRTRFANDKSWHSGYRLEGAYGLCDGLSDLRLRWTHFPTFTESRTVTSPTLNFILPLVGGLPTGNTASIRDQYQFYTLEALYEYKLISCCPIAFSLDIGLQYAHLNFDERTDYLDTTDIFLQLESKREAIGIETGFECSWAICRTVNFDMRALGSLLVNHKKLELVQTQIAATTGGTTSFSDDPEWIVTPALNLRAGFDYHYPTRYGTMNIALGYEFLAYFNAINRIQGPGAAPGQLIQSFDMYMDFILHGLYVQAGLSF